jgi:hypothetical protein
MNVAMIAAVSVWLLLLPPHALAGRADCSGEDGSDTQYESDQREQRH